MSYCYSDRAIEDMYRAGILHKPGSAIANDTKRIIEKNIKCPKCNSAVKMIDENTIECVFCKHIFN